MQIRLRVLARPMLTNPSESQAPLFPFLDAYSQVNSSGYLLIHVLPSIDSAQKTAQPYIDSATKAVSDLVSGEKK
jgi:hypothetical protein